MRAKLALAAVLGMCVTVVVPRDDGDERSAGRQCSPVCRARHSTDPSMPGVVTVSSGSALSATKFLTSAHCFDPTQPVFVSCKTGPPFSLAKRLHASHLLSGSAVVSRLRPRAGRL
jgi:hypothetical protein